MPIAPTIDLLTAASARGYAVGGFEPYNFEQIQAVMDAASELRAPVIVQLWKEVIGVWGLPLLMAAVRAEATRASVPVAVHLDHAVDDDLIDACLDAGFNSVMFDGSRLPFEENLDRTRDVVRRARPYGASVEAELGVIGTLGEYASPEEALAAVQRLLTTPEQAELFVRETGIQILAPAIGSVHGCPLPMARLDLDRIAAIRRACGVPIALHGGSGVSNDQCRAAIAAGIAKVNVDAEVRGASIAAVRAGAAAIGEGLRENGEYARLPLAVRGAAREVIASRIRVFGSEGRA